MPFGDSWPSSGRAKRAFRPYFLARLGAAVSGVGRRNPCFPIREATPNPRLQRTAGRHSPHCFHALTFDPCTTSRPRNGRVIVRAALSSQGILRVAQNDSGDSPALRMPKESRPSSICVHLRNLRMNRPLERGSPFPAPPRRSQLVPELAIEASGSPGHGAPRVGGLGGALEAVETGSQACSPVLFFPLLALAPERRLFAFRFHHRPFDQAGLFVRRNPRVPAQLAGTQTRRHPAQLGVGHPRRDSAVLKNSSALRGNELAPRGNELTPRGNELTPRGNELTPRGNELTPRGNELTPRGNELAPRGNELTPRGN
jgi:hypothetical protein